jgi:hypothetical protein
MSKTYTGYYSAAKVVPMLYLAEESLSGVTLKGLLMLVAGTGVEPVTSGL